MYINILSIHYYFKLQKLFYISIMSKIAFGKKFAVTKVQFSGSEKLFLQLKPDIFVSLFFYFFMFLKIMKQENFHPKILSNFVLTWKNLCHKTQALTNSMEMAACVNSHIMMFKACVRSNNSLPFLMHKMASRVMMAPYTQHWVPTLLQRVSVT